MEYAEVIRNNIEKNSPVKWWPRFAFHYTDVLNAVNILDKEYLYSRDNAQKMGLMVNDNASRQVIDMTNMAVRSNVRFYFRPLTPTQYYNEGYKHPQLRYENDTKANVPVPIFFLFNLNKLLAIKGVKFSEVRQAGKGTQLYEGVEEFSKLDFGKIYSRGYEDFKENLPYRQAEILHPNSMKIDSCIESILCRNPIEKMTLLNLIKEKNSENYLKYRDKIKICKYDMFEYNGLYINDCNYLDNVLSIRFSDTFSKREYTRKQVEKNCIEVLEPLTLKVVLDWLADQNVCEHKEITLTINYNDIKAITLKKLPDIPSADIICIKVYIEDDIMCCIEQSLEKSEIIL